MRRIRSVGLHSRTMARFINKYPKAKQAYNNLPSNLAKEPRLPRIRERCVAAEIPGPRAAKWCTFRLPLTDPGGPMRPLTPLRLAALGLCVLTFAACNTEK